MYPVHAADAVYDPDCDASQQEHLSLLGELRRAVEQGELRLYYQPKVTLSSSTVTAAEALLRWVHPTRGLVPPSLSIPFAEHAVPARMLCLEITESGFMEDPRHAQKVLERLAATGLQLSIDDYGTGYSSLCYIMRLPVSELKIDRSFVSNMTESRDLTTIVRSTIELGHSLGLKVVAEGVEDPEGFAQLRALGCDSAQGYYMSPPLPAQDFRRWLAGSLPQPTTSRCEHLGPRRIARRCCLVGEKPL